MKVGMGYQGPKLGVEVGMEISSKLIQTWELKWRTRMKTGEKWRRKSKLGLVVGNKRMREQDEDEDKKCVFQAEL